MIVSEDGTSTYLEPIEVEFMAGLRFASGETVSGHWVPTLKIQTHAAWGRTGLIAAADATKIASEMRKHQAQHDGQHARWDAAREDAQRRKHEQRIAEATKARDDRRRAEAAADQKRIAALKEARPQGCRRHRTRARQERRAQLRLLRRQDLPMRRLLSIAEASRELRCSPRAVLALGSEGVLDVVDRKVTAASVTREARRTARRPTIETRVVPAAVEVD